MSITLFIFVMLLDVFVIVLTIVLNSNVKAVEFAT